jgi:hypothetical protein
MMGFLSRMGVLLKDFGAYVQKTSERLKEASCEAARRLERPIVYLPSAGTRKEDVARQIAERDGIREGLICILTCVEPCRSYEVHRDRSQKKLVLESRLRKCLHLYHYWIEDLPRAQKLMDRLARISWPSMLRQMARQLNPAQGEILGGTGMEYYWSVHQSEWATDVLFQSPAALASIYPGNSVKIYDKQGSVLRVETTINDPSDFRVFRPKQGAPEGPCQWQPMRKGIADLLTPVCRPRQWKGGRVRALQPWSPEDRSLLQAINRGEFALNGIRNRDLAAILFPRSPNSPEEKRRASGRITRKLRLLRAHGILRKVPRTHRYVLTKRGRQITVAALQYQNLTLEQLNQTAA